MTSVLGFCNFFFVQLRNIVRYIYIYFSYIIWFIVSMGSWDYISSEKMIIKVL